MTLAHFYLWMASIATPVTIVLFLLGLLCFVFSAFIIIESGKCIHRSAWWWLISAFLGFLFIIISICSPSSDFWIQTYKMYVTDNECLSQSDIYYPSFSRLDNNSIAVTYTKEKHHGK